MSWFKKPYTAALAGTPYVIEVPKPEPLEESPESVASVASLEGHPGFRWLLRKLSLQQARLRAELENSRHAKLEDVQFLQSGIQWTGWLASQLDFAKARYLATRAASPSEAKFFEEISSYITLVGATSPASATSHKE